MKKNPKKLLITLLHSGMEKNVFIEKSKEFRTGRMVQVFYPDGSIGEVYAEEGIDIPFFVDFDFKIEK